MQKKKKKSLNSGSRNRKSCWSVKHRAIFKNPNTVLQRRLRSFHWSFLEISVMKHYVKSKIITFCGNSAFSQILEQFLPQNYCKETSALFPLIWWINLFHPLNANSRIGQTHSNNSSWNCRRIVWVCLTILWDCGLKG